MRTSFRALVAATVVGLGFAAAPAFADEPTSPPSDFTFSGYVQGVTDYRFRGISASGGDPAIQGSINVNHKSGFYAGAWASSIQGGDVFGHTELDLYGGWTGKLTPGLTADVGLLYYVYPNGHVGDANYFEPYASLAGTVGPVSAKVGVAYAFKGQDALGDHDNVYVFTDVSAGIPHTPLTLTGHLGYANGVQGPKRLANPLADDDGLDYSAGVSYAITDKLSISAAYVGVDGKPVFKGFNDDTVVATLKLAL
jgi:uncharacterized protein (TIGR02001 family)